MSANNLSWRNETDPDKIMENGGSQESLSYFLHQKKFQILRNLLESKHFEEVKRSCNFYTRRMNLALDLPEDERVFLQELYDEWWVESCRDLDIERIEKFRHPFWDHARILSERTRFYESLTDEDIEKLPGDWHRYIDDKNPLFKYVPFKKVMEVGEDRGFYEKNSISKSARMAKNGELVYRKILTLNAEELSNVMVHLSRIDDTTLYFWANVTSHDKRLLQFLSREEKLKFLPILIVNNPQGYRAFVIENDFTDEELKDVVEKYGQNYFVKAYQESSQRGRIGRAKKKERWLDNNGQFVQYFKIDGKPVETKQEYFMILDEFLQSGLSSGEFCHDYKISDRNGFLLAHERRCREDEEYSQRSKDVNEERKRKLFFAIAGNISDTLQNFEALSSILNEKLTRHISLEKFTIFSDKIDKNLTTPLLKQISKYYKSRLDEYKGTLTEDDLKKMLTNEEVNFITAAGTEKEYEFVIFGDELTLDHVFCKRMERLRAEDPRFFFSVVSNKKPDVIAQQLKRYNYRFDGKQYLREKTQLLANGTMQDVTKEEVDKALLFAKKNNLYPSTAAIRDIIRAIKLGNIKSLSTTESGEDE